MARPTILYSERPGSSDNLHTRSGGLALSPAIRLLVRSDRDLRLVERHSDQASQIRFAIWLHQQQHAGVEPAVVNNGTLGVTGCIQNLQPRSTSDSFGRKLAPVHETRHDHVGKQEVDIVGVA